MTATDGPGRPQTPGPDTDATATENGPAPAEFRAPATHAGGYHDVMPKRQLAIHLGVWHRSPTGRFSRISYPGAAVRGRWKLDTLRDEHRRMHEEPTE